jgi:hypothetical protein
MDSLGSRVRNSGGLRAHWKRKWGDGTKRIGLSVRQMSGGVMGDVGLMILWTSMARAKTLMNYQKRARKMKRIQRRLRLLRWVASCVCVFQDVI